MRKLLLVPLTLALFLVTAAPASAIHWEKRCRDHGGPDGGDVDGVVCVAVNGDDTQLWEKINGISTWNDTQSDGMIMFVEFDYIRLVRINLDGSETIVESKATNVVFDERQTNKYLTPTYDTCVRPTHRDFYGQARYRLIWKRAGLPDAVGTWNTLASGRKFIGGCGV